ncbi:MAG TPA: NTP transferase domain-containing protein [Acidimicrobiales bacterium]|jgi:bifunctional UDP-N-acetylglucosamine pyrophosphorylase/glucosamine-1-phosphate N-acetyltransferase
MTDRPLSAMVLAAGEGTRMRSTRPKPLHLLCGRAMLLYVLDAAAAQPLRRAVVVVGHGAERVTKKLQEDGPDILIEFVEQRVQRGTGDAASVGLTGLMDDDEDGGDVLVLPGDTPLLRQETVAALVEEHLRTDAAATVLTAELADPTGYGRIVRGKDGRVARIVEEGDATDEERAIVEVNTSIYCFRRSLLAPALRRLSPENSQGEYYLTDVVGVLHDAGYRVESLVATDPRETAGVNDRVQLAAAEAELRRRTNERWLCQGVTMVDPGATYLDATVSLSPDVTLFPGVLLQGRTVVGAGAEIGPDCRLVDCVVGAGAKLQKTVASDAEIGAGAVVGPFAALDPGSHVAPGVRTGPFYTGRAEGTD